MEQALLELIELAKSAAPELWRIALAQTSVSIYKSMTAGWVMVGFSVIFLITGLKQLLDDYGDGVTGMFLLFFFATLGVAATVLFIDAKAIGMNPEYEAIKILVGLAGLGQ